MDEKTLLMGFLTKTLNMDETALTEVIYKDDAVTDDSLTKLLAFDVDRVKKVKGDTKTLFDNGYKKAEKEVLEKLEAQIREEYALEATDLRGIDLVKELVTKKAAKSTVKDDEIKVHPLYLALEKKKNEENKALKDEYDKKVSDLENGITRREKLFRVKDDAKRIFSGLNPVISENATVAANREKDFLSKFDAFEYELDEKGNHLIMNAGARMEDGHGNPVTFESFVKDQASLYYDFKKQEDRAGAGNNNNDDKPFTGAIPKDEAEYLKAVSAETDPKKRIEIQTAYYKSIGKQLPEIR